jgi:hypothetical protein
MHILCRFFGHRRSLRRITPWHQSWQTECLLCSTRLMRVRHGKWVPFGLVAKTSSELRGTRAKAAD